MEVASVEEIHDLANNQIKRANYSRKNIASAQMKLNQVFGKLLGKKAFYYLLMIVSLGLELGAGAKWHG